MRGKAARTVTLSEGYDKLAEEMERLNTPRREPTRPGFIIVILVLAAICAGLGTWQMMRLSEKEAQIARIAERADLPPRDLPAVSEWVGFDPEVWDYRRARVTGTFLHDQTVLVFTSLSDPRGPQRGPGYWVLAPLALADGGTVWVNRGFVPESLKSAFADGGAADTGEVEVTGLLRRPEVANAFTPGADRLGRVEWIRDPDRLTALSDVALDPVLPAYLDADAQAGGGLPQGGETKFTLPNKHLEYAVTWYGLSAVAVLMLGVWLFGRRKR